MATCRTKEWVDLFGWKWQNLPARAAKRKSRSLEPAIAVPFDGRELMLSISLPFFFLRKFTTNLVTFSSILFFLVLRCYFALIFCMCMCVIFIHLYSFSFLVDDVVCYSFCCFRWSIERFYLWLVGRYRLHWQYVCGSLRAHTACNHNPSCRSHRCNRTIYR